MEEDTKSLQWWLDNLSSMRRGIWLWIPREIKVLTSDTPCTPIGEEDDELSDEEKDRRDEELEERGLQRFFFKDQLEDIKWNLEAQKSDCSQQELLAAINYYWENDAFIDMGSV